MGTHLNLAPAAPDPNWLLGHAPALGRDVIQFITKHKDQYDGIFRIITPITKIVAITKPEYVDHVMRENNRNYTKSFAYDTLKLLLGKGLLTSEGDFWRTQRRLIQPAFHKQKIELYAMHMMDATRAMIGRWKQSEEKEINVTREMSQVTLDIVSRALFGHNVEKEIEVVRENLSVVNEYAINRIKQIFRLPVWLPLPANIRNLKSLMALNKVVKNMITERRKNPGAHEDLLTMLITARDEDTGEAMDDKQLRDEVMTIFLAGHETTAVAMNWLWYLVSSHPDVQQKLYNEVSHVFDGRSISFDQLRSLTYTKQVIDESMRLYPPAWVIGRKSIAADKIGPFDIEPHTNVLICTYVFHHDKKHWGDDAEEFKPERFTPDKAKDIHHFVYFPFGGGPRLCIGNSFALTEMQILVAMLIKEFQFESNPSFIPEKEMLVTLRSKYPLRLKVNVRN